MNTMDMKINQLPAYTYNWLHMNGAEVPGVSAAEDSAYDAKVPELIRDRITADPFAPETESGAGRDMDRLVKESGVSTRIFSVRDGVRAGDDAVRLGFSYAGGEGSLASFGLNLGEDSEMTVVMDYASDDAAKGFAGVQTKIRAAKGSLLHLIQIQRLGKDMTFINDIGGICEEGARVELVQLILSGGKTYEGCRIHLAGDRSTLGVDIGYKAEGKSRLDMNYDSYQTGKKTSCEINASGVLRDGAFKLFRGTIDFQKGCSGSTGDEMEEVLLLNEGVVNQTIPLILCAEEDVVGNHGASIGRLDESLMFYMMSRGMDQQEIYEMMAKAKIDAVIRKIPDGTTRSALEDPEEEE